MLLDLIDDRATSAEEALQARCRRIVGAQRGLATDEHEVAEFEAAVEALLARAKEGFDLEPIEAVLF